MNHTPTPWDAGEGLVYVRASGILIADCQSDDDAAHIIKAVNAHGELVRALQSIASLASNQLAREPDNFAARTLRIASAALEKVWS